MNIITNIFYQAYSQISFIKIFKHKLKQAVECWWLNCYRICGSILKVPFVWDNGFKFKFNWHQSSGLHSLSRTHLPFLHLLKFQWFLCCTEIFAALERFLHYLHWNFLPCLILFWTLRDLEFKRVFRLLL